MTDTIFAQVTPPGESAIAMIRICGPLCSELSADALRLRSLSPRIVQLAYYHDVQGNPLDQVLATYFEKGRSFTGDDSLEIFCHGNPLITELICEDLLRRECRLAEPGEFTKRAFLNGKIDLSQAEAVAQIISAKSKQALIASQRNLKGDLSNTLIKIQGDLLTLQALIEAQIDFPEEDINPSDLSDEMELAKTILDDLNRMLALGEKTQYWNKKIRIVLIGLPNSGKSSLLNLMAGKGRAIVHHHAGTTRDYLELDLKIGQYLVTLVDTAGLIESQNEIEKIGVGLSIEQIKDADILLWVIDDSVPYPDEAEEKITQVIKNKRPILVRNKNDLGTNGWKPKIKCMGEEEISCLEKKGLNQLTKTITNALDDLCGKNMEDQLFVNERNQKIIKECVNEIVLFRKGIDENIGIELMASHLNKGRDLIDLIIGTKTNEQVLDIIFKQFCIGK